MEHLGVGMAIQIARALTSLQSESDENAAKKKTQNRFLLKWSSTNEFNLRRYKVHDYALNTHWLTSIDCSSVTLFELEFDLQTSWEISWSVAMRTATTGISIVAKAKRWKNRSSSWRKHNMHRGKPSWIGRRLHRSFLQCMINHWYSKFKHSELTNTTSHQSPFCWLLIQKKYIISW